MKPDAPLTIDGEALTPLTAHGIKLMSMGFINPGVMPLRGAKVSPVVQQLVGRTTWGELDYLLVDMPPGTGQTPTHSALPTPCNSVGARLSPCTVCGAQARAMCSSRCLRTSVSRRRCS